METSRSLKSGDIVFVATPKPLYRRVAGAGGSRASRVGIVFEDAQAGWVVAESALPLRRYRPLDKFLGRSDEDWFVVRRLRRDLTPADVAVLRAACDAPMGRWWRPDFKDESERRFGSKFVHEVYRQALGIDLAEVETFSELLRRDPQESPGLWKRGLLGFIAWRRKVAMPAGRMQPTRPRTVWHSGNPGNA